jgi:phosphoribosylamine--glycine ligase
LVNGIVDYLEKFNIKVFGPNKVASQLEGSKIFTKKLCKKYNIPTANFGIFENKNDAKKFLEKTKYPNVIKADNLAAGKGVYICNNEQESLLAVEEIFDGKFGEAKNVLIEEFLKGEEMSYFIISDGTTIKSFETAQDHKRVLEGDNGKNTGGMGAYSPSRLISSDLEDKILSKIIKPTLKGLSNLGTKYKGFLYAGLMIVKNEPYLIEYNVRMGDPECQTILPKLKTDLVEILEACCNKKLADLNIEWTNKKSLCVVLCSKGYPDTYKKNVLIDNLENFSSDQNNFIFHAGTKKENDKIYAIGGRVLNFISLSDDFLKARNEVHQCIKKLDWNGGFFRKDIGFKVID